MAKAKVKRYQTGGVPDDDDEIAAPLRVSNPTSQRAATTPPILTRPRPLPSLVNTNPITSRPAGVPTPPSPTTQQTTSAPTGSTQAVAQPQRIAVDKATGVGSGGASAAETKQYMDANSTISPSGMRTTTLPSGGLAITSTKPYSGPKPTLGSTGKPLDYANPPPTKPVVKFIYGGRVDMTPPGNVGFKRPGPFKMGGKVGNKRPMPFMHGGKVKMFSGGRVQKMQSGGKASDLSSASELNDMFNSSPETAFLGKKPSPTPKPTPKPKKMQDGGEADLNEAKQFLDRVKGVSQSIAEREPDQPFMHGGKVRMRAGGRVRKMQDGGPVNPQPFTPTPLRLGFQSAERPGVSQGEVVREVAQVRGMNTLPLGQAQRGVGFGSSRGFRSGGRVKYQDGGMVSGIARSTDAEIANENRIHVPPRHQFQHGGLPPDNVPALLGKGEVVLNKNQQKKVVVKPNWQKGLNPKERSAMATMPLPRMRTQRAMHGMTVPRIFGGK